MMRKVRNEDRQEKKAAMREAAGRRKRRNFLLRGGVIALLVVGAAALIYRYYTQSQWLNAVKTATYPAGLHAVGQIAYAENPPIGGTHNAVWQNCGIYATPIHNEHAVHSMEHGAVWITYRPDLPADQVERLRAVADDDFMLLSPYPGLPANIVLSSWNRQLTLAEAADPRLPWFISQFKNNPGTTPEFGAPCAGGTSLTAATALSSMLNGVAPQTLARSLSGMDGTAGSNPELR
jgi:hypothetical protein